MKNKKTKSIFILVMSLMLIFILMNNIYATTLNLNISTDKQELKKGDKAIIKVSWDKPMQAADYILKYESSKLKYVKSSIEDTYIRTNKENEIGVSWFSQDNKDLTEMTFEFEVIDIGETQINVTIDGGFSDGKLSIPDNYNLEKNGSINLKIEENKKNNTLMWLICAVILLLVVFVIYFIRHLSKKIKVKK